MRQKTILFMVAALLFGGMTLGQAKEAKATDLAVTANFLRSNEYSGDFAFGIGAYGTSKYDFSFYMNTMFSFHSESDHYDSLTIESFGDPVRDRKKDLFMLSAGPTYGISEYCAIYSGLGFGVEWGYVKKYDPMHILSDDGIYYVDDPSRDNTGVNLNVGLLLFLKDFTLEFGYHTFPQKTYLGAGWRF